MAAPSASHFCSSDCAQMGLFRLELGGSHAVLASFALDRARTFLIKHGMKITNAGVLALALSTQLWNLRLVTDQVVTGDFSLITFALV